MASQATTITSLETAIHQSIAFFSVFDHPLTAWEAHKYLWRFKAGLGEVLSALEAMKQSGRLEEREGFYFLPGRQDSVWARKQAYMLSEKKYAIGIRAAKLAARVPGVQLVAVCNSLALAHPKATSDIDFFIITEPGRIFITRLLVTVLVHLARLRRHGNYVRDRVCLSFYLTSDQLTLDSIRLSEDDAYLAYWLVTLDPLYSDGPWLEKIFTHNPWVRALVPQAAARQPHPARAIRLGRAGFRLKHLCEGVLRSRFGTWLERVAKRLQLYKMSRHPGAAARPHSAHVVVSDAMLKFHEQDRRRVFYDLWQKAQRSS